jgi:membrane associated rhomboid family serine protease
MNNFRPSIGAIPPVVKNLIIINAIFFLGDQFLGDLIGVDPVRLFGLHYFESSYFQPWQYVTSMFMHGGLSHIFFNMFALFMFGRVLEQVWGAKRFLIYYFVCGLGASALHTFFLWFDYSSMESAFIAFQNTPSPELLASFVADNIPHAQQWVYEFLDRWADNPDSQYYIQQGTQLFQKVLSESIDVPTVGASGAVFGLLLAFGMLFPNTELMLLFPPIPIRAKYFVALYGLGELYFAVQNSVGDNVAHVAHLGGMLFGFVLIKYWNKSRNKFY